MANETQSEEQSNDSAAGESAVSGQAEKNSNSKETVGKDSKAEKKKAQKAIIAQQKVEKKAEKKAAKEAAKQQKQASATAGKSPSLMLSAMSLLLALGACGASYWLWLDGNNRAKEYHAALSQVRQQSSQNIERLNAGRAELENKLNQALLTTSNQQQQLVSRVDHLNEASKAISERLGRNSTTWIVAEADYLMNIASHRLKIDKDINAAIAALQSADSRLKQVGDPGLLSVRRVLADEINALRSQSMPDIAGMAFELASLAATAEQLPLIVKQRREQFDNAFSSTDQTSKQSGTVSGVMKAVWTDLKSLVVIRKNEKPVEALLAPDQRHFLFQNLILKIETGRLALLRGEQDNMKASLDVAQQWLQAYFDRDSAAYKNFTDTISRISSTTLNPSLPDISRSLRELRQFNEGKKAGKTKTGNNTAKKIQTNKPATDKQQTATQSSASIVPQQPGEHAASTNMPSANVPSAKESGVK